MIDQRLLRHLSKKYPNIKAATEEIVNLSAILALPKGTEYFLSDLHGEHEAFIHMLKSASGVIRSKIEEFFGPELTRDERDELAALIYNAEAEIKRRKRSGEDFEKWCKVSIFRLVVICKSVTNKYTRSKVRKRLPKEYAYIIDELLHNSDDENKGNYYGQIIATIVECGIAEDFIIAFTDAISSLAVDKLHIIGDIWDRGAHPDAIMDFLMGHHDVDFQWGNHDIVWMGAATGNWACITNVLRMNISYNNFDMLEIGYGINLRPLAVMAEKVYGDDPCQYFMPKRLDENKFDPIDDRLAAKMNKAISICQFKVEGQRIMAHPEYGLENRLLLDKIDFEKGTVRLRDGEFPLRDTNFPTIDPENPYELTEDERNMLNALEASFLQSEKLQAHIRFIYSHGALYTICNGNLMYHGCIPMDEEGNFEKCTVNGITASGKEYMDYLDSQVRKAYFEPDESEETGRSGDLMWYLWLSSKSPLFGKDQMTTFERCFVADKATHKEHTVPYYKLINRKEICEKILLEFGLDPKDSIILNGHVPVKIKDGESPVKGEGKLIVIDGGMSKAYQKQTGIAGYTFIFNSRFMALAEHKPYSPLKKDGTQEFHTPVIRTVKTLEKRMLIKDTDIGEELQKEADELKALVRAYRTGRLKEM
ncbi:MAG TPA: fructose-1,6-bisphosphatase [Candidatus Copromorpha excrementipullorum]|uniref:Fructose-1,6-bisphosphatase class 3 n=1 Tax=Candidatus Allocopromorpha excrementipullorum TaxID=2840743 RepID=A0A9D1SU73_9FIRM|nr:fructose-1,6-bisphosphatase [Candidatus Copromorpha excrementipullorum]